MVKKKFLPTTLIIDIVGGCNARCPMCTREAIGEIEKVRPSGFMDLELYLSILNEAKSIGVKSIRLYWWGEPTLNKNLGLYINKAKELGFHCTVSTNGHRMDKFTSELLASDWIRLSLDGWDLKSFSFLRKGLDFNKVLNNLKFLYEKRNELELDTKISINCAINRFTDFSTFLNTWSTFVDEIVFCPLKPVTLYDEIKHQFTSRKMPVLENYYYEFDKDVAAVDGCGYLTNTLVINYVGKIALCCEDISISQNLGTVVGRMENAFNEYIFQNTREQFQTREFNLCNGCQRFSRLTSNSIAEINEKLDKAISMQSINQLPKIIKAY